MFQEKTVDYVIPVPDIETITLLRYHANLNSSHFELSSGYLMAIYRLFTIHAYFSRV